MKNNGKRVLAIVLALAMVASAGYYSSDHFLKATEGEDAAETTTTESNTNTVEKEETKEEVVVPAADEKQETKEEVTEASKTDASAKDDSAKSPAKTGQDLSFDTEAEEVKDSALTFTSFKTYTNSTGANATSATAVTYYKGSKDNILIMKLSFTGASKNTEGTLPVTIDLPSGVKATDVTSLTKIGTTTVTNYITTETIDSDCISANGNKISFDITKFGSSTSPYLTLKVTFDVAADATAASTKMSAIVKADDKATTSTQTMSVKDSTYSMSAGTSSTSMSASSVNVYKDLDNTIYVKSSIVGPVNADETVNVTYTIPSGISVSDAIVSGTPSGCTVSDVKVDGQTITAKIKKSAVSSSYVLQITAKPSSDFTSDSMVIAVDKDAYVAASYEKITLKGATPSATASIGSTVSTTTSYTAYKGQAADAYFKIALATPANASADEKVTIEVPDGMELSNPALQTNSGCTVDGLTLSTDGKTITFDMKAFTNATPNVTVKATLNVDAYEGTSGVATYTVGTEKAYGDAKTTTINVKTPSYTATASETTSANGKSVSVFKGEEKVIYQKVAFSTPIDASADLTVTLKLPEGLAFTSAALQGSATSCTVSDVKANEDGTITCNVKNFKSTGPAFVLKTTVTADTDMENGAYKLEVTAVNAEGKTPYGTEPTATVTYNVTDPYYEVYLYGRKMAGWYTGLNSTAMAISKVKFVGGSTVDSLVGQTLSFATWDVEQTVEGQVRVGETAYNIYDNSKWTCVGFVPTNLYADGKTALVGSFDMEKYYEDYVFADEEEAKAFVEENGFAYGTVLTEADVEKIKASDQAYSTYGLAAIWYVNTSSSELNDMEHGTYTEDLFSGVTPVAYEDTTSGVQITSEVSGKTVHYTVTIPEGMSADELNINLPAHEVITGLVPGNEVSYTVTIKDESGNEYVYQEDSGALGTRPATSSTAVGFEGYGINSPGECDSDGEVRAYTAWRCWNEALTKLAPADLSDDSVGAALKEIGYGSEEMSNAEITKEYLDDFYLDYYNTYHPDGGPYESFKDMAGNNLHALNQAASASYTSNVEETNTVVANALYYLEYAEIFTVNGTSIYGWMTESSFDDVLSGEAEDQNWAAGATDGEYEFTYTWKIDGLKAGNAMQLTKSSFGVQFKLSRSKGSLKINKTFTDYSEALDGANAAFRVVGVDKEGNEIYNNVVGMVFTSAGTQSVTIEGLPVGATFTVTEIYDGASYEGSSAAQSVEIKADTEGEDGTAIVNTSPVSFSDSYDDSLVEGHGTVNHYEYSEESNSYAVTQINTVFEGIYKVITSEQEAQL